MLRRLRSIVELALLLSLAGVALAAAVYVVFAPPAKTGRRTSRAADFDVMPAREQKQAKAVAGERVPEGALARLGTLRWRLGNRCSALAYSPDATRLLSVESQTTIRVWDCATGQQVCYTQPLDEYRFHQPAMSPDNGLFAAGARDGIVYVFDGETGRLLRKLSGHLESAVRSIRRAARQRIGLPELEYFGWAGLVQFSPDGQTLYSVGGDGFLRAWNVSNGKQRWGIRGHTGGILALAVSQDGKHVASGGFDGRVRLWDAASGERVRQVNHYQSKVRELAFDPQGEKLLVYTGSGGKSNLEAFDIRSQKLVALPLETLLQHVGAPGSGILLSPDGQRFLFGDGKQLKVGRLDGGEAKPLSGTGRPVERISFALARSPAERVALVSGNNSELQEFPAAESSEAGVDHRAAISAIVADLGGKRLATGDGSGVLRVWDRLRWRSAYSLQLAPCVFPVRFTSDGGAIGVGFAAWQGDDRIWPAAGRTAEQWRFFDATSSKPCVPWQNALPEAESWWCVHGTNDGRMWVLVNEEPDSDSGRAAMHLAGYNAAEGRIGWQWRTPFSELLGAGMALENRRVWATGMLADDTQKKEITLALCDAETEQELWRAILEPNETVIGATRGNRFLAVGKVATAETKQKARQARLRLLDIATGRETLRLDNVADIPRGRWADGKDAVVALPFHAPTALDSHAQEVRIIETASGNVRRKIAVPAKVNSLFVSQAGQRLAFDVQLRSEPHRVEHNLWSARLIDIDSGRTIWKSQVEGKYPNNTWIDFIDDDQELLASPGDGALLRIDPASGKNLPPLAGGHTQAVTKCVLSFDKQRLITGANDGHVAVWRRSDGRWLHDFHGHRGPISLLTILPDGNHFASGSHDSTVVIWPLAEPEKDR